MRPTTFPGSPPRFAPAIYRQAITETLDAGLSLQRIRQDLVEECGSGASYEPARSGRSAKRFGGDERNRYRRLFDYLLTGQYSRLLTDDECAVLQEVG